jgi:hypothetical protein
VTRRVHIWAGIAIAVVAAAVPPGTAARPAPRPSPFASFPPFLSSGTDRLRPGAGRRVAAVDWRRTASAGVTVLVSPAYDGDPTTGRRWADFFASLVHGPELSLLTAYIASPAELAGICAEADGCYSDDRLWVSDQPGRDGVSPQEIAAHEYGHHVAFNRENPPWLAIDWGTKRWATAMNVCARGRGGTAYPGAENFFYPLNPGEAFAESYRVLNGYGAGDWSIVDGSFRPTPAALDALRTDVLVPWTASTPRAFRVRVARARAWVHRVSTPLDGSLTVSVAGTDVDVQLRGPRGAVVARGSWTASGTKSVTYEICGDRSFTVRVVDAGAPERVVVRITEP